MSRLSRGEREFVSGFGDLAPDTQAPEAPPAPPAPSAAVAAAAMEEIDARGLAAPLPLLRAHRALRGMKAGQELRVVTSYAQSLDEFQAMVKHVTDYELVSQDVVGEEFVHVLRRRRR